MKIMGLDIGKGFWLPIDSIFLRSGSCLRRGNVRRKARKYPEILRNLRDFHYMAFRTTSFSGMLGMPPERSVDRLAAAAAKRPI